MDDDEDAEGFEVPRAHIVCSALIRPFDQYPFGDDEACARIADDALPNVARLAKAGCPEHATARMLSCLSHWRRARALASTRFLDKPSPPLWFGAWFVIECLVRHSLRSPPVPRIPPTRDMLWIEESATLDVRDATLVDVKSACYLGRDAAPVVLAGFATLVAVGGDRDHDWVLENRPTFAALRLGERHSALRAAEAEVTALLDAADAARAPPTADHDEARVRAWLASWRGSDLAEGHRERLAERFLGVTPVDLHSPAVAEAPDREGSEARARPRGYALAVSRPEESAALGPGAREATKRAFEDPALEEAAGVATLGYAVQQACQVEVDGAFVFWADKPFHALAHLTKLPRERGLTRRVPRLVQSDGAWYVVVPGPEGPNARYTTTRAPSWAWAVAAWCALVRDDAKGMLGRNKCATNAVLSVLRPPASAATTAAQALRM